ncbi:hypothetical protein [Streptococcus equi]|uniref:hypothetical protein n=1 Tax=Streptococcus equi TaxID=1336 RepID=UPI003D7E39DA
MEKGDSYANIFRKITGRFTVLAVALLPGIWKLISYYWSASFCYFIGNAIGACLSEA